MAGNLSAMVNKMNEENEQKELLISSQKVSGEEARRLIVNRQNVNIIVLLTGLRNNAKK